MSRPPPNGYHRNPSNGSNPTLHMSSSNSAMNPQSRLGTPQAQQRPPSSGAASRAERFEDEKRRIIESCFSKLDANGQLSESYITHIRIQEDSVHSSSPPPPDSPPENRKPRLIIIAVRSTGRVRMHKARENNNGSFSIGKTWNLEELSAIESFSNSALPPKDDREAQYRSWAGGLGFIVTITKPYYWQAGTSKEKDFFIASAVKIYRKYTKGLIPELRGFDEHNQAVMLGAPPGPPPPQAPGPSNSPRLPSGDVGAPSPPQPPFAQGQRPQSREDARMRGSPGPQQNQFGQRPSESPARPSQPQNMQQGRPGHPSPVPRSKPSSERMRSKSREPSRPGMRSGPSPGPGSGRGPPPSSSYPNGPSQQRSQANLRSESPAVSAISSSSREAAPSALQPRSRSPPRQKSFERSTSNAPQERTRGVSPSGANGGPPVASAGAAAGAALMNSTRQRWQQQQQQQEERPQQQQQPLPPQQPQPPPHRQLPVVQPPTHRKQPSISQLPPLETTQSNRSGSQRPRTDDRQPQAAQSGASSAGVDPGDAATISGMNSFYGAEPTTPAEPPAAEQPTSPLTPERSRKRPQFDSRASEVSADLRPPPLKQSGRQLDGGSTYAASNAGSTVGGSREHSTVSTPAHEEPPEIKPLAVQKPSETNINMPGAFVPSPQGPSPQVTPVVTPVVEKEQAEAEAQPTSEAESGGESQPGDAFRPGLGPMVKKRAAPGAAADRFRKAAFAANAFKPRPGGAAERILKAKAEKETGATGEADGITGVFRPHAQQKEEPAVTPEPQPVASSAPTLEVTSPVSPLRMPSSTMRGEIGVQLADGGPVKAAESKESVEPIEPEETPEENEETQLRTPQIKIKRRSLQQEKYLGELGIDKSILEGKGIEFENLLLDFGWGDGARQPKQIADFENDVKRQLGRVEAGSWLSQADNAREDKVTHVEALLDKAIAECDELEGLLTLYSVELGSLNEDIQYIEAQSQGLQVQSANQQLLHTELTGLIETISLNRSVLEPLRYSDIADPAGLEEVEHSLVKLYQAMVTMDPSVRSTTIRPKSRLGDDGTELSRMAALREKKEMYSHESKTFCKRLLQHLDFAFTSSINSAKGQTMKPIGDGSMSRLNKDAFTNARTGLWIYSPLVLFSKELNIPAWQAILEVYHSCARVLYADSFKENIAGWKRAARQPTGEESELLFTHIEKEAAEAGGSGLGSTARKMTIKRSHTLAKTLRNASGDKKSASEIRNHGSSLMACEVFAGAMDEMAPLISQEQNFVVDYFHATSLETLDFVDVVTSTPPERRRGTNLLASKPMDPDREMARRVTGVMDEIFSFFTQETSVLLDWAVSSDPIQGVGVLVALSKHAFYLADTAQEYLLQLLDQLSMRLQTLFAKFVDDQIRAIEETKVKIHKRKGVIAFMRIFPHFSAAVENVFSSVARADYDGQSESVAEVRRLVDDAYSRINRSMFDSLKVIAKESPTAGAPGGGTHTAAARQGGADDPEDKEMLNYNVLLIENMNHYIEEVDDGGREGVLSEWRGRAMLERQEALEAYVGRVVRRPLGKLLDFVETLESQLASNPGNPAAIASRTTFSRKTCRHFLADNYNAKEVRKGIDTLRRRIEKHFGDVEGESANVSRNLVGFVCAEAQKCYEGTLERTERLMAAVYPNAEGEKNVEIDFGREDIKSGFRR